MSDQTKAKIKVIGVGGAGMNLVNYMIETGVENVEYIAVNTDGQALEGSLAENKIQIGEKLTKGLGAGADPEIGRKAAEENIDEIKKYLDGTGTDMVFVLAGMGGGTGTGAAPVIAEVSRAMGNLTVGVITMPFDFEGPIREEYAVAGRERMSKAVDTLIPIQNDKLREYLKQQGVRVKVKSAFNDVNDVPRQAVYSITDMIQSKGYINVDFADVKKIMSIRGDALMGIGVSEGDADSDRALIAARSAMNSPLLERNVKGARGLICSVAGGEDFDFEELTQTMKYIRSEVAERAEIIFGLEVREEDENFQGKIQVTVIATGFEENAEVEDLEDTFSVLSKSDSVVEHDNFGSAMGYGKRKKEETLPYLREATNDRSSGLQIPEFMRRKGNGYNN